MSGFHGGASGGTGGLGFFGATRSADKRLLAYQYSQDFHLTPFHATNGESYRSPWWPRSALDASGGEMVGNMMGSNYKELPPMNSGAVAAMGFVGVSRDGYGSILGSCTMKLFKTANGSYPNTKDTLIYEVVSDSATGFFSLYTPYYPDTHYIVQFKTGTPDVQGVTVNTLIGS